VSGSATWLKSSAQQVRNVPHSLADNSRFALRACCKQKVEMEIQSMVVGKVLVARFYLIGRRVEKLVY
jgi:hypothetical protein